MLTRTIKITILIILILPVTLLAQQVLKPQEAFPVSISYQNNVLQITHEIQKGYYLYKDKISYSALNDDFELGKIKLPNGIEYTDEFFGATEIYRSGFTHYLPINIKNESIDTFNIEVNSQGCADIGLCYPPQKWIKTFSITLKNQEAAISNKEVQISEQARLGNIITDGNILLVFFIFLGLGFGLAFTPCHLPTIPILSSIIIGQSGNNRFKSLSLSLSYVAGMAITYSIAGIAAAIAGKQLQALFTLPTFIIAISILFGILGFSMLGSFNMQMPSMMMNKINNSLSNQSGGNYIGVMIIGALSALMVTACVAPPLVATLMVIGESGNIARGIIALSSLSLGLGIPLIIIGLTAGKWLPKSGAYLESIKNLFGFIMFAMAIWVLNPLLSDEVINLLWGIILIAAAIYFLWPLSKRSYKENSKSPKFYACLGTIILGLVIVSDQRDQMVSINDQKSSPGIIASLFEPIGSLNDLDNNLELASKSGDTSLLYITADWCISCKRLERETFSDPAMIELLSSINSIKADVSKNTEDDIELMKKLSVFGPPTLIVYDQNGIEKENIRKIGVVNAKELIRDIKNIQQ